MILGGKRKSCDDPAILPSPRPPRRPRENPGRSMERRAEAEEDGVVVVVEGEEEEEEEPFPVFERQLSCRATTCVCGEGARGRREEGELTGECVCARGWAVCQVGA